MSLAEKKNLYPVSVEANRKLLQFDTWNDYLDSLIEFNDMRNLRSLNTARIIAALGYRANTTLTAKEFNDRRKAVEDVIYPKTKAYIQVSEGIELTDPFARELAARERQNRLAKIHSIIFIRNFTAAGFEISGYIDYAQSLEIDNWTPFFKNNKIWWPKETDLGYYHWRHDTVRNNITRNYKPLMDPELGLIFQNRHDHKIVCPDPKQDPGENTTKERINSPKYAQIEIYDHVVRRKR